MVGMKGEMENGKIALESLKLYSPSFSKAEYWFLINVAFKQWDNYI